MDEGSKRRKGQRRGLSRGPRNQSSVRSLTLAVVLMLVGSLAWFSGHSTRYLEAGDSTPPTCDKQLCARTQSGALVQIACRGFGIQTAAHLMTR